MSKLNINLVKDGKVKTYRANIDLDYHAQDLCDFLYGHQDKELELILNGKKIKFNSAISRKKFAQGFQMASKIFIEHTKEYANQSQRSINKLTNEMAETKAKIKSLEEDKKELAFKIKTYKTVSKLRAATLLDTEAEWKDTCEVLKTRLKKLEPVIKILRKAGGDGDINKAVLRVRKNGL